MIITVEGNIGCGKSTFIKACTEALRARGLDIVPVYEPVSDWTAITNPAGESMFDLYYKDKAKYAYVFQSHVLLSRVASVMKALRENPGAVLLCERSIFTDYEIFAKVLHESGDINEMEWNVYNAWHAHVREVFGQPIAGTIYLRATPETCMQRIQRRNRQSEDKIDEAYIVGLHKKHEQWLMGRHAVDDKTMLALNANLDFAHFTDHVEAVASFAHSLTHRDS